MGRESHAARGTEELGLRTSADGQGPGGAGSEVDCIDEGR